MLTPKGAAAAILSGLGLFAGLALDNPLYLLLALLLASLLVAAALTVRPVEVRLARAVKGDTANEGDTVTVELSILARGKLGRALLELRDALPGEVELADGNNYAVLDLRAGESTTLRYAVRCPVKGFHALGPVRVRVEDPFGMFHRDQVAGDTSTIKVYPRVEDLKDAAAKSKFPFVTTGPFLVGNPGTGSAFFALREYNRGDSMRDVNWKASARSKSLVVNQRERESQSEITLLLDARASGEVGTVRDNTFLYSCRAAASLVDFFLANRSRVSLVLYGEDVLRVNRQSSQNVGIDVLEAITRTAPRGAVPLEQVVDQVLPTIKPRTPVYLLSGLVDDPTIERAVAALRAYDARVVVVSPNAAAFARATAAAQGANGSAAGDGHGDLDVALLAAQRERTLAALRGMGALVLDWQPGASLGISMATGVI